MIIWFCTDFKQKNQQKITITTKKQSKKSWNPHPYKFKNVIWLWNQRNLISQNSVKQPFENNITVLHYKENCLGCSILLLRWNVMFVVVITRKFDVFCLCFGKLTQQFSTTTTTCCMSFIFLRQYPWAKRRKTALHIIFLLLEAFKNTFHVNLTSTFLSKEMFHPCYCVSFVNSILSNFLL